MTECAEDTKPATTAYGRMMDDLVGAVRASEVRLNAVFVSIEALNQHLGALALIVSRLESKSGQDVARQQLSQGWLEPANIYPNNGGQQGTYPNVQPQRIALLRSQLKDAASLLESARQVIEHCLGLAKVDIGFAFAGSLTEVDVAYWMQENPSQCLGAFDLKRLQASIKK